MKGCEHDLPVVAVVVEQASVAVAAVAAVALAAAKVGEASGAASMHTAC